MSKKGENIYKRKDKRWEARYIKGYASDGKAIYGYCYGKTYKEAKEKSASAKAELKKRPPRSDSNGLICDYCDGWLRSTRLKVRESTYVKYYAIVEKHIKPSLGRCKVTKLTTSHIESFTQQLMTEAELSPKTVKDILVVLKSVLKYAEVQQSEYVPKIDIAYPREKKKEIRILSKEEQAVFIRYLMNDDDPCKFGTLFALLTGLRIGEICALRWENISLGEETVTVGATMQRLKALDPESSKKTKILVSDPKSDTSARVIPLSNFALELCMKNKPIHEGAFVLTGVPDKYVEPRTLQYRMERYASDCGLDDVHFHTLRHTFATRCVEGGFEIKSLSEILGHSAPQITLNRYVHSSMELKRENMNKVVMFAM